MKQIFYKISLFIMICFTAINCTTNDDQVNFQEENNIPYTKSSLQVGYVDSNGNFIVIDNNVKNIKAQWDTFYDININQFEIKHQLTDPNPDESGNTGGKDSYLLIGIDTLAGKRVGMVVERISLSFQFNPSLSVTVECQGCPEGGCELSTKDYKGTTYPYCANPYCASNNCKKIETDTK